MRMRAYSCSAGPISIQLSLEVVSDLALASLEAWKSVPRRGLEIGGILRGRHLRQEGRTILVIDGFQAVESEHLLGPSYKLSTPDRERFDHAARAHPAVVGIFRTHTRREDPFLQDDDVALFHQYFSGASGVFLLIHPARSQAEFFVPEGDLLVPAHSFPFRAWDLPSEGVAVEVVTAIEEAARVEEAALEEARVPLPAPVQTELMIVPAIPAPIVPVRRRIPARFPVWAVVGVAGLAGWFLLGSLLASKPRLAPAPAVTPAVVEASSAGHFGLTVTRDGDALRFQWDQDSSTIRSADHGKLEITDGKHQSELNLNAAELSSGLLSYWPDSADVTVRLQVYQGDQVVTESIHAPSPSPPATTGEADRSAEPDPHDSTPAPVKVPGKPPAHLTPRSLRTEVTVIAEPVEGSRQRYILSRIPLLRRLKKHPQLYVPPAPVHRVAPSVSAREWHSPDGEMPVDVRVSVGSTGRVQRADLVSSAEGRDRDLASAALYAARLWAFAPARLGSDKVPGEVMLHFRFGPREAER